MNNNEVLEAVLHELETLNTKVSRLVAENTPPAADVVATTSSLYSGFEWNEEFTAQCPYCGTRVVGDASGQVNESPFVIGDTELEVHHVLWHKECPHIQEQYSVSACTENREFKMSVRFNGGGQDA